MDRPRIAAYSDPSQVATPNHDPSADHVKTEYCRCRQSELTVLAQTAHKLHLKSRIGMPLTFPLLEHLITSVSEEAESDGTFELEDLALEPVHLYHEAVPEQVRREIMREILASEETTRVLNSFAADMYGRIEAVASKLKSLHATKQISEPNPDIPTAPSSSQSCNPSDVV